MPQLASPCPAGNELVTVPAPSGNVYRVTRIGRDPFEPAPLDRSGDNRFDDPLGRFQVIYCASERIGAFGECLARFRRSVSTLALMAEIDDDEESLEDALDGLIDPSDRARGVVPLDWRLVRQVGVTQIHPSLQFADIMHPGSLSHVRVALAPVAAQLGLPDVDLSVVLGPNRTMTQHCARYVYQQSDDHGLPRFSGIRYVSRHNTEWECWAIFADRFSHTPRYHETSIDPNDAAFLEVARLMNLSIQLVRGRGVFLAP